MPLLTTPNSLTQRAEFYRQLGTLLHAGIPLVSALGMVGERSGRVYREKTRHIAGGIEKRGLTFSETMAELAPWFPAFDIALLGAGEKVGRLDASFGKLALYYEEKAVLVRRTIAGLMYPILMLHLLILIAPISALTALVLEGNATFYVAQKAVILIPLWAVALALAFSLQARHAYPWRRFVQRITDRIPLIGSASRDLALARLALALEGLVSAGVSVIEGWQVAADASGSPRLKEEIATWAKPLESGETPAERAQRSPRIPHTFSSLYSSGEISGQLDQSLRRIYEYYQEEGSRKMTMAAEWAPRLAYFAVAIGVAIFIFKFWSSYFSQLGM